ncbi:MAG: hypothetical protein Fur0024_3500 [Patescibacteria group bacterium]
MKFKKNKLFYFTITFLVFGSLISGFFVWKNLFQKEQGSTKSEVYFGIETNFNKLGKNDAEIKIVEFASFDNEFSAKAQKQVKEILMFYKDKVSLEVNFLENGNGSINTSIATLCAGDQGKFFSYLEKVFIDKLATNESIFSDKSLQIIAKSIDLNEKKFLKCLTEKKYEKKVLEMTEEASGLGIFSSPAFFVNGRNTKWTELTEIVERQNYFIENNKHFEFDFKLKNKVGTENAKNQILLFVDFGQIGASEIFEKSFDFVNKNFENVNFEILFAINPENSNSFDLAIANYCAMETEKFWDFLRKISEINLNSQFLRSKLINYAEEVGIEKEKFEYCVVFGVPQKQVLEDVFRSYNFNFLDKPVLVLNDEIVSFEELEGKLKI